MSDDIGMDRLMSDVDEVIAILGANLESKAEREGREVNESDVGYVIQALLTAAYIMGRDRIPNEPGAGARAYLGYLRSHIEAVECSLS